MADLDSGLTDSQLVNAVQKANKMFITPEEFGAVGDGVADDTVAFQAALDAIPHFKHYPMSGGSAGGGGTLFLPSNKYLITGTLYYANGTIIKGHGRGTIINFFPTGDVASTMWLPDPDRAYNADYGGEQKNWDWIEFEDITFTSNLLKAPYVHNMFIDLIGVMRWRFTRCYFESWDTVITCGLSYYHRIEHCEFYQNRLCIDQQQGAQPIVIVGGVMYSYTDEWIPYVDADPVLNEKPDEFIKAVSTVMIYGTSLEPWDVHNDPETFVSIRCTGSGSFSVHGGYAEGGEMPYAEIDMNGYYKHIFLDLAHNYAATHFRLKNFFHEVDEEENYPDAKKTMVTGSGDNGVALPLPNGGMRYGGYLFTGMDESLMSFDTSETILGSKGVLTSTFDDLGADQWTFRYTLNAEMVAKVRGSTITVGMLLKGHKMAKLGIKVQDSPTTNWKQTVHPIVRYGKKSTEGVDDSGWGLYIMTYDVSQFTSDELYISTILTPEADDGTSNAQCGGVFVWVGGHKYFPVAMDTVIDIKASSFPTETTFDGGDWSVGDKIYNDAPIAGGSLGWICTVAGAPGTWKSFGTIEA